MKAKTIATRLATLALCAAMAFCALVVPQAQASALGENGTYRALLVAYTDGILGTGPYNDVMMMKQALIKMGVPEGNIRVVAKQHSSVTNRPQTGINQWYTSMGATQVQNEINTQFNASSDNDVNIFYYSGHGIASNTTQYGSSSLQMDGNYGTEAFATHLGSKKGKHLVMLDCCFSGGLVNKSAPLEVQEEFQEDVVTDFQQVQARGAAHNPNFFVLTAATARESSLGGSMGILTRSICNGLGINYPYIEGNETLSTIYSPASVAQVSVMADQNRDGQVTLNELYAQVYNESTASVPTVYPQNSNEVLFRYSGQRANVANMRVNNPGADYVVSGSFNYYGSGKPVVNITATAIVTKNGSLAVMASPYTIATSNSGSKYSFSGNAAYAHEALRISVVNKGYDIINYSYAVEVQESSLSKRTVYRKPFIMSSEQINNKVPTLRFLDSTPQPSAIKEGGQEYRLRLTFDVSCYIDVYIYDRSGNKVRTLAENQPSKYAFSLTGKNPIDEMEFYWDGKNDSGKMLSGTGYYARAIGRNNIGTGKWATYNVLKDMKVGESQGTWIEENGKYYFVFDGTNNRVDKWQYIDGAWYYFKNTVMQTGWQKVGSKWYYMEPSGIMVTGWKKLGGKWYFMENSGRMVTGWKKIEGKWYYMDKSGVMQKGWEKVSGKWYYLEPSGAMATGWKKLSGKWYYLKSSGAMGTGWQKDGSSWYYMKPSGVMVTGNYKIGGRTSRFASSGKWLGYK